MDRQPNREIEIFNSALERTTSAERAAYLDGACGEDAGLRTRIEALIRAHEQAGGFLPEEDIKPQAAGLAETIATTAGMVPVTEKVGDRIGRYKLLQQIGEGGCGVVYMAEQQEPVRRKVALKVIKLGMDTKSVIARFEAERQALALMDHPNIAKVLDAGATQTGRPYFVMELVHGIKITDYCDQNNLDITTRLNLFIQVCQAVQHAHQKGIIHRDLKPSNILVTLRDGVPVPKVIDFGIAKATTDQRLTDKTVFTAFEQFMGTPAYMSPEQAEMSELGVDTRSDIYSLGILLYELLTGGTPFDAKQLLQSGLDAMRKTIREQEPLRPSTRLTQELVAADVRRLHSKSEEEVRASSRRLLQMKETIHLIRGDLDWIVMKALEKDRTRRYETANGLAADIKRHLNSEPVVACPPSNLYRLQKLIRRNKLTVTAAGAVVTSLVLGLVFSSLEVIRATKSERSERGARIAAESARTRESASEQHARSLLYAADMRLVQQAWDEGNLSRMTRLLEAHRPKPGEPDERGFEYFYFQNLAQGEQEQVLYHATNAVLGVAISPDGKWLSSRTTTETRLWDLVSRNLVAAFASSATNGDEFGLDPSEYNTSFSFDSQYLSIPTEAGLQLYQIPTRQIQSLSTNPVSWAGFSPVTNLIAFDENAIVTTSNARVWDYLANKEVHAPGLEDVFCWSPEGSHLLAGLWYSDVLDWDTATWSNSSTNSFDSNVSAATISPDGRLMAAAEWQGLVHLTELIGGKEIGKIASGDVRASALAFSPDGKLLATGSGTEVIQVWDLTTRQRIRQLRGHQGKVTSLAFSHDGRLLASSAMDGEVRLWNFARPTEQFQMTNNFGGFGWNPPLFSPDGKKLALQTYATSGGEMTTGVVLNASSLKAIGSVTGELVSFSPDSRQMVTMIYGKVDQFRVWSTTTFSNRAGVWLDAERIQGHPSFSRDGCFDGIGFWTKTGDAKYSFHPGLLNAGTGEIVYDIPGDAAWMPQSHFLPDGRIWAYTVGSKIMLFDLPTGTNRLTLESHSGIAFMAISPDGKTLAASHANDLISLWDLDLGRHLGTLAGHQGHVLSLAFSSDGRTLASGSEDRTIKLWHLATQRELASFTEDKGVYWLSFSPDNQMLVSGEMGFYHFWRAPRDGAEAIPLVPKLLMADLPTNSIWRVPDGADQMSPRMASEQNQCFTNMSKIYSAIMAYRKDNLQMPDCLSDLVPKYLSDTNCLICPVCRRTGKAPDLAGMNDAKFPNAYFYEFNAHTNIWHDYYGVAAPGDTMKMWKEKQLLRYGPIVPVVRCALHTGWLAITFAGERRVDHEQGWEKLAEEALKLKLGAATNAVPSQ